MRTFATVTTCHSAGWKQFGQRMAFSFDNLWPKEVPLLIYTEGFTPEVGAFSKRVDHVDLHMVSPWLQAFKDRNAERSRPTEVKYRGRNRRPSAGIGFIHDAIRFSHKVAAMCEAIQRFKRDFDVLVWLDADTLTHEAVDVQWLSMLFPEGPALGLLQRRMLYSETGIIFFNLNHVHIDKLRDEFQQLYIYDRIFSLDGWTDCHAIDAVAAIGADRKLFETYNLSGEYAERSTHPFINSRIGERMDHLKGPNRKIQGRSPKGDLRLNREERYWK